MYSVIRIQLNQGFCESKGTPTLLQAARKTMEGIHLCSGKQSKRMDHRGLYMTQIPILINPSNYVVQIFNRLIEDKTEGVVIMLSLRS